VKANFYKTPFAKVDFCSSSVGLNSGTQEDQVAIKAIIELVLKGSGFP
jgi:hypothetical protein